MDDHHLTVYFKSPYPAFFEWSTQDLGIVPKAYVEKVGDAEFAKHPIGAGPFKWVDYQQDVFVKAEAVEDHYRKVPAVKTVQFKFSVDPATLMAMFKAGEADVVQLPIANIPEVKNDPKLKVVWSKFVMRPSLIFCDLAFPNEPSPFMMYGFDEPLPMPSTGRRSARRSCMALLSHGGIYFAPYQPGCDPNIKPIPMIRKKPKPF